MLVFFCSLMILIEQISINSCILIHRCQSKVLLNCVIGLFSCVIHSLDYFWLTRIFYCAFRCKTILKPPSLPTSGAALSHLSLIIHHTFPCSRTHLSKSATSGSLSKLSIKKWDPVMIVLKKPEQMLWLKVWHTEFEVWIYKFTRIMKFCTLRLCHNHLALGCIEREANFPYLIEDNSVQSIKYSWSQVPVVRLQLYITIVPLHSLWVNHLAELDIVYNTFTDYCTQYTRFQ